MFNSIPFRAKLLLPVATLATTLCACSLSGHDGGSSIYVDLSSLAGNGSRYALLNANGGILGLTVATTLPTSASGFACYGVNVTGPGIADTGQNGSGQDPMIDFYRTLNEANRYCSYRGIVTPPLLLSGGSAQAALQIPPGGLRLVQVVGVNDATVCASGVLDDPPGSTGGGGNRFFELGRAVLTDVFGDRSVDVAMSWPTGNTSADDAARAARSMDCGDGNCTVIDKFDVAAPSSFTMDATYTKIAQKISSSAGSYLKRVDVNLAVSTADDVTVSIFTSAVGGSVPTTDTGYSKTLTFPAATSGSVTFDIGTSGNYLQMLATYDYWIVVSSAHASTTAWKYATVSGSSAAKYYSTGPSWQGLTGSGFDYRIQACN